MTTFQRKVQLVESMHHIVCAINNENAYCRWIYLVPDEADISDFTDIAEDNDLFKEVCELFRELISLYGESGFYIIGERTAY